MSYDGAVGVLDFQDARLGPQPYDLVSLLTDRGTPDLLGSALMTALIDYYIQRMEAETGRRTDRDAFDQLFDYVAIQRCLKATGTFAAMAVVRQRPQYLPYIPPTLTYLQPCCGAIMSCNRLPGSCSATCRSGRHEVQV
jgi:aminoglycoside/choline kinase family phosphotransferase